MLKRKHGVEDVILVDGKENHKCFFETEKDTTKVCLAAESFGSRLCYAEKTQFTPRENEVLRPAKISDCVFVINQALSLRALQEILTHAKSQQEVRIPTLNVRLSIRQTLL